MRIKNLKKFIRSLIIISGLCMAIVLLIQKASYTNKEVEYKTICISKGDTLWNIAKTNQESNSYYKDKDVRYILNDIVKINKLENSNININQELIIPVL